jgi:hypothetical protein
MSSEGVPGAPSGVHCFIGLEALSGYINTAILADDALV